jgi:hypothetical protein
MTQRLFAVCGVCPLSLRIERLSADSSDGLRTIYRAEGTRGLYKGSLLALVGVSNGSIQFATYEAIKRRRTDIKRKLFASQGKEWKVEDEKLVSAHGPCPLTTMAPSFPPNPSGRPTLGPR